MEHHLNIEIEYNYNNLNWLKILKNLEVLKGFISEAGSFDSWNLNDR